LEDLATEDVGIFHCHLVYFIAIWSILLPFGMFFSVWVCCTKKNLATLRENSILRKPRLTHKLILTKIMLLDQPQ
jgi:hypothetical protein